MKVDMKAAEALMDKFAEEKIFPILKEFEAEHGKTAGQLLALLFSAHSTQIKTIQISKIPLESLRNGLYDKEGEELLRTFLTTFSVMLDKRLLDVAMLYTEALRDLTAAERELQKAVQDELMKGGALSDLIAPDGSPLQ